MTCNSTSKELPTCWMLFYVIYRPTTSDHRGKWVVREHRLVDGRSKPEELCTTHESLADARRAVPPGLTNIGRFVGDDPVIEEVWC